MFASRSDWPSSWNISENFVTTPLMSLKWTKLIFFLFPKYRIIAGTSSPISAQQPMQNEMPLYSLSTTSVIRLKPSKLVKGLPIPLSVGTGGSSGWTAIRTSASSQTGMTLSTKYFQLSNIFSSLMTPCSVRGASFMRSMSKLVTLASPLVRVVLDVLVVPMGVKL